MRATRRLVLWDVDYTLVDASGATHLAFARAFRALFGRPLETQVVMAGRCELAVVPDLLRHNGVLDADRHTPAFLRAVRAEASAVRAHAARHGRLMPGADEALAAVAAEPGTVSAVVTGNSRAAAVAKLAAFGLDVRIRLEASAFGDEAARRGDLVHLAVRRAGGLDPGGAGGWAVPVVIGDTPEDVRAAREAGATPVGVATGVHGRAELERAGAAHVLGSLRELEPLRAVVRLLPPAR